VFIILYSIALTMADERCDRVAQFLKELIDTSNYYDDTCLLELKYVK